MGLVSIRRWCALGVVLLSQLGCSPKRHASEAAKDMGMDIAIPPDAAPRPS